jgi:hypothetical protein
LQAAGGEAEHGGRLGIEPLRIVDHCQQRAIGSRFSQQRQHTEADQETIRRRPEDQPESDAQRVALRRRQPVDRAGKEPEQPVQRRITEGGLRFNPSDDGRGHPPGVRRP